MKKWDKIIIATLLVISLTPYIVFSLLRTRDYNYTYAHVYVEGELYETINLTKHQGVSTLEIETPYGNNVLEVNSHEICVVEADCSDQVCVWQGIVSRPGQSLVCLPHKMYVQIEGVVSDNDVDITVR